MKNKILVLGSDGQLGTALKNILPKNSLFLNKLQCNLENFSKLKKILLRIRPTIVVNPNAIGPNGKPLYSPNDVVRIISKTDANTLAYTYTVRAYTESYNYLRVIGGVANVVFSS